MQVGVKNELKYEVGDTKMLQEKNKMTLYLQKKRENFRDNTF